MTQDLQYCDTCRFCKQRVQYPDSTFDAELKDVCMLNPPTVLLGAFVGRVAFYSRYPIVKPTDTCGQWRPILAKGA